MSEVFELVLDLVFNVIGGLFEIWTGDWAGGSAWPDTKGSGIFWGVVLMVLADVIWWEVR